MSEPPIDTATHLSAEKSALRNTEHLGLKQLPDFSDLIYDNSLEFHKKTRPDFPITHKIESLGNVSPPPFITHLLATQLVTLSGAMSGFLAGIVVCPLDVVKTRLQAKGADVRPQKSYGFLGEFSSIIHREGIRGLYRGLVPITIGYLPTWTIYFTVYARAKLFYPHYLQEHLGSSSEMLSHMCLAITAGMTLLIAVNPIWVVKTRLMTQRVPPSASAETPAYYSGTIDAFRKMYREEGLRVFYSGLVPSLFGLLHVGIHFPVYEKLKQLTGCNQDQPSYLLGRYIFASLLAKMVASTITYPHEILRTRMQIRTKAKKPDSLKQLVLNIYKKEGWRGFYAGYMVNLARTVPASAVTLVSFEYFKTYLLEISGKSLH